MDYPVKIDLKVVGDIYQTAEILQVYCMSENSSDW